MLETLINPGIIDTNDEGLRQYTHEWGKVFAKFTADNCPICKQLAPTYSSAADNDEYQGILFIRLESDENPVAKHMMAQRVAPFFVSYCQGRLLECDTCETGAEMYAQLDRLQAFVPPSA